MNGQAKSPISSTSRLYEKHYRQNHHFLPNNRKFAKIYRGGSVLMCGTDIDKVVDKLADQFDSGLNVGEDEIAEGLLQSTDIAGVIQYIKEKQPKNIVMMVGAGISVNAGIPDFRTEGTGLYSKLEKYNLPYPEAIFELGFFKRNPQPFFTLAQELFPGQFEPTLTHHFINLLHKKEILLRCWSQNIDSLETLAGLPKERLVAAHGNFDTAACVACRMSTVITKEMAAKGEVVQCELCEGYVKPGIVFFGEQLPSRFFQLMKADFTQCDLLIVLGTSLVVHPFAGLVSLVDSTCPRLLINKEKVGEEYFEFDSQENSIDALYLGDCDDGVRELARGLGWEQELIQMMEDFSGSSDESSQNEQKQEIKQNIDDAQEENSQEQDSISTA